MDVQIQRPRVRFRVGAPDPLIQNITVERLSPRPHQNQQQRKLPRGQLHRAPVLGHGAVVRVYLGIEHPQRRRPPPGVAQKSLDPGQQLRRGKRLDDVVIRAQLQPAHPVRHGVFRRQKDDRRAGWRNVVHQCKAVHARQHDVQQHQIKLLLFQQVGGLLAVAGQHKRLPQRLQRHLNEPGNMRLIIHDQNRKHRVFPLSLKPV